MRAKLRLLCITVTTWLWRSAHEAWHESAPAPRPARRGIEVPIRPSRQLRWLRIGFFVVQVLFGVELLLLGHRVAAMMVLALMLLPLVQSRLQHLAVPAPPRRLMLAADGRLHLMTVRGELEPVQLQGESVRLGPWLLLTLRGSHEVHRLVLGPDNVDADALAALRRRLSRVNQAAQAVAPGLGDRLSPGMAPGESGR